MPHKGQSRAIVIVVRLVGDPERQLEAVAGISRAAELTMVRVAVSNRRHANSSAPAFRTDSH